MVRATRGGRGPSPGPRKKLQKGHLDPTFLEAHLPLPAALLGSSAPSQGSTCIDRTPEVTARPSVKMEVLQESSEPQLLLALSEAWGRPSGGHLRGQGAWISLLQGSLSEAWPGHPAAVRARGADSCGPCLRVVAEVLCAAPGRQPAPWLHGRLSCHQR